MKEYHKIDTVFKRDPATNHKALVLGDYAQDAFAYLANNEWVFTEKVDGTNIRVMVADGKITFGGKTDAASIPAFLVQRLQERFLTQQATLLETFPDGGCLYGEGYGARIQKGGGNYRADVDFVLFDVRVGEWWLQRGAVQETAAKFGLDIVPIIGRGTLHDLVDRADSWIRKHFKLILGDPLGAGDRDEDITLQWLLDRAESAVLRHDIHMLIIDPWNELEHARDRNESVTDYTGRAIRQIKRFARQYNVLVMLCVHPTKDFTKGTSNGKPRHVTLYDCEGSAHWANKADIGIVVERDEEIQNGAKVTVAKLRYKKYGTCGSYAMQFDTKTQRYRAME